MKMKPEIISRQPDLPESIFSVMTRLAQTCKAINLAQGFPDFDVPRELIESVHRYMCQGYNQYAPMPGVFALRQAVSEKILREHGRQYDPDTELTITAGATEALFAAILAAVRPGDEVIVFEPWYDAYLPAIRYAGGVARTITLHPPDFQTDWPEVRKRISTKTRMIILNSPHNPTGRLLTAADLDALSEISADSQILLLSDEVYEHIVYDGRHHFSLASRPVLAERSFVISSFGKTFHATGWKTGFCAAPPAMTNELRKAHQFITYAVNTPIQYMYAEALKQTGWFTALPGFYQQKRDYFRDLLQPSRFRLLPVEGSYFQLADYSEISNEPDMQFCQRLTIETGVAAIPTSAFYLQNPNHRLIRFCFAKKEETLRQAAEKLCKI